MEFLHHIEYEKKDKENSDFFLRILKGSSSWALQCF
jgi:hypothetical protein